MDWDYSEEEESVQSLEEAKESLLALNEKWDGRLKAEAEAGADDEDAGEVASAVEEAKEALEEALGYIDGAIDYIECDLEDCDSEVQREDWKLCKRRNGER